MLRLVNGRILRDGKLVRDDLWIETETGRIVDPLRLFYECKSNDEIESFQMVDCKDMIISPGFIDLQFNGGFGVDFSSPEELTPEDVLRCAKSVLATGVTSFCPTLISLDKSEYAKLIPMLGETDGRETQAASMIGLHLEGPYFSLKKIGAHPLRNIRTPEQVPVEEMYGGLANIATVRLVTSAPELPRSGEMMRTCLKPVYTGKSGGKRVMSIGHSAAGIVDAHAAIEHGATMITHLFNAMGSFHHRDPGIIGLLGCHELHEQLFYGIIADGFHAHRTSISIAYQSHPTGAVLVTDAMSALGLSEGVHHLGDSLVEIRTVPLEDRLSAKKAVLADDSDTLAGAVISMVDCVRNFQLFTGCTLEQALEAATLHPARCIGIAKTKGTLDFGADGDVVILDEETLSVKQVFIKGSRVYKSKE